MKIYLLIHLMLVCNACADSLLIEKHKKNKNITAIYRGYFENGTFIKHGGSWVYDATIKSHQYVRNARYIKGESISSRYLVSSDFKNPLKNILLKIISDDKIQDDDIYKRLAEKHLGGNE